MNIKCDLCEKEGMLLFLSCSSSDLHISENDLEDNIMDHSHLQYMCKKCISKSNNRCPFCLMKYIIRYEDSFLRNIIIKTTVIVFLLSVICSIGLSYIGLIGGYNDNPPKYEQIGYIFNLLVCFYLILFTIMVDYRINDTMVFLWMILIYNGIYITLIFFRIYVNFIPWVNGGLTFLTSQGYLNKLFCVTPRLFQKPDSIIEILRY